eukprot:gb/GFBE01042574.1/.p1 GENE.gb/GFBE01042574.1/~~gb/GFBE01042574.1/.p1  ORF type:complete len:385 (+),score=40.83 gb/GFBE01042574.1/:1-1155(+)
MPSNSDRVLDTLKCTKLCKFYFANRCKRGNDCSFAHSEQELQQQPDLLATRLCAKFLWKGRCKDGVSCRFAHGHDELRALPPGNQVARGLFDPREDRNDVQPELQFAPPPVQEKAVSSESTEALQSRVRELELQIKQLQSRSVGLLPLSQEELMDDLSPMRPMPRQVERRMKTWHGESAMLRAMTVPEDESHVMFRQDMPMAPAYHSQGPGGAAMQDLIQPIADPLCGYGALPPVPGIVMRNPTAPPELALKHYREALELQSRAGSSHSDHQIAQAVNMMSEPGMIDRSGSDNQYMRPLQMRPDPGMAERSSSDNQFMQALHMRPEPGMTERSPTAPPGLPNPPPMAPATLTQRSQTSPDCQGLLARPFVKEMGAEAEASAFWV